MATRSARSVGPMQVYKPRMGTPEYEDYLRERRCGHKGQYSSRMVATNAATALGWVNNKLRGMEAYPCEFCGCWHVGHPYFRGYLDTIGDT